MVKKTLVLLTGLLIVGVAVFIFLFSQTYNSQEFIEIGGVFHLSGPGSFWGLGEYNGAMLAIEEINNERGINKKEIKLIVEDSGTDFPKTVSSIQKLVNVNDVEIIIGPTWFGQVASPLANDLEVFIISPSSGVVPEPNPYFFDVWPTEKQEIVPLVQKMKKKVFQILL